jgi:phosphatidate phosphatase APP1
MGLFAKKELTAYPAYAYRERQDENFWVVALRVWVHKRRDIFIDDAAVKLFERKLDAQLSAAERERLKERFADFIADDDYFEKVEFQLDGDSEEYEFSSRTDWNGLVEETFRFPAAKASRLSDGSGFLTYIAKSDGAEARGRIRLLEPRGISVVSDIDDTIKVTEVPAGNETVLRRTFLMDYETAVVTAGGAERQMRDLYWDLQKEHAGADVSFHYVSGSPWQMYKLLDQFLMRNNPGFPEGTFHMKNLRKNLTDPDSWTDLISLAKGKLATLEQKIEQITELMVNLPERRFILVGDSGEMDPEVFLAMNELFEKQVQRIIIRDVLGDRLKHEKIEVLPGSTVRFDTTSVLEKVIEEKKLDIKLKKKAATPTET